NRSRPGNCKENYSRSMGDPCLGEPGDGEMVTGRGVTMTTTRTEKFWRFGLLALAAMTAISGWTRPAIAQQVPVADDGSGMQVLTQGPVHEAFAEPVEYDPQPGPVIPKQPPAPPEEMPPEQKPEGDDV